MVTHTVTRSHDAPHSVTLSHGRQSQYLPLTITYRFQLNRVWSNHDDAVSPFDDVTRPSMKDMLPVGHHRDPPKRLRPLDQTNHPNANPRGS